MNSLALGTRDGGLKKSLMGPQPSPLCSTHLCGIYRFSVLFLKYIIYCIYLFYLYIPLLCTLFPWSDCLLTRGPIRSDLLLTRGSTEMTSPF